MCRNGKCEMRYKYKQIVDGAFIETTCFTRANGYVTGVGAAKIKVQMCCREECQSYWSEKLVTDGAHWQKQLRKFNSQRKNSIADDAADQQVLIGPID